MSWKLSGDFFINDMDALKTVCTIEPAYANKYGKIIEKAPEMFAAIKEFIDKVDHGSLKPKEAYNKFKNIIDRIEK